MKRILAIMLLVGALLTLCACGNKDEEQKTEETVGGDGKAPLPGSRLLPIGLGNGAQVGLGICVDLRETGKILILEQHLCSLVHRLKINLSV